MDIHHTPGQLHPAKYTDRPREAPKAKKTLAPDLVFGVAEKNNRFHLR
jgi:hypothetical protein